jgi:hypothetical protein
MASTTLKRRVASLEANGGGYDGCERCTGTVIIWEDLDGEFISARWNGEDITEEELHEREAGPHCAQCGREIDPDEGFEILLGGDPAYP